MLPRRLSPPVAAVIGAILFLAMLAATELLARLGYASPAERHIEFKAIMLLAALGLMLVIGRTRQVWGLAAPRRWMTGLLLPVLLGGALGAGATATILGLDLPPMAGLRDLGFLRIVLIIWIGSTLAEEVFVRGLVQGWMQPLSSLDPHGGSPGGRIVASGLLFGAMHASILFTDTDPRTAAVIIAATTILGLTCAWSRERTGSLAAPLLAHLAFNACGILGGIAVILARRATEG